MDGSSSTGNPTAASSRWLPAHADEDTLQPDDWISASEEDDRQSRESFSLHQSPEEKHRSPEETQQTAKKHQKPAEKHLSLKEKHQSPAETQWTAKKHQSIEEKHQSPVEKPKSPTEKHQSPAETQRTAKKHQSPAEKHQNLKEKHQSPVETQRTAKKHQKPEEKHQSPVEKPQSPTEKHQSPKEKHQSPKEKHQSAKEKHQSPAETQRTAKKIQITEEKHRLPEKKHQSPVEKHQSPAETEQTAKKHQKPAESEQTAKKHQKPAEKHQSLKEKHQSPVEKHQSPEEKHQSLKKKHQNPWSQSPAETQRTAKKHQSPVDKDQSPEEKHQSPVDKDQSPEEKHQSPVDKDQSPEEKHQSPVDKDQSPEEKHQSPVDKDQSPEEKHQSPVDKHQSPEEKHQSPVDKDQSPEEKHQSPVDKDQSPEEKHQSPAETQQTAEKSDCLGLTEQTNHKDPPEDSPTKPDQLKPNPLPTEQKQVEDSPPTEKQKTVDASSADQLKPEDQAPRKNEPNADQPKTEKSPPAKPDQTKLVSLPTEKQKLGDAPSTEKQEIKDSPEPDQPSPTKPDPLFTGQEKPADLCRSNHEQKPEDSQELLRTEEGPPPLHLNTQQPPLLPLNMEVLSDQPRPLVSPSGEPKLCGFLQKQGGPLKAWKQRWFTYEGRKNQLFYYRTPQDVTPLGRVELCSATFTYPLKAESGTFHIKTPERTFVLKAVTQELMLYWLQQLQVKRWQHRQTSSCPNLTMNNNNNTADDFLPALKSPLGLVGEKAANVPSQGTPLGNMSLKHPLIVFQNSFHSLRKRSSQECSQSVFHVDAPPWIPPNSADTINSTDPSVPRTPTEPQTLPPPVSLAEPAGQVTPAEGRESPSLLDSRSRNTKSRRSSTMTVLRKDTLSSERMSRLDKQTLVEEVKAQKELVWILHKALEASQLEKRTCAEFLAEKDEQERLELLRHRERLAADLRGRLEEARTEIEALRTSLAQRDAQLAELQENIQMLREKDNAKQEVIIKLSDQLTSCLSSSGRSDSQSVRQLQQQVINLKDDIEAYQTQNQFLNSEIYQLTKLWRTSSEQEKTLMVKCSYLEASVCQVESRYLGVLRQLQENKTLEPAQRGAVQKMIEDALKGELKSVVKLNVARDHDEYGFKIIPDYEVEDMKLLAKIQALEIRSHNLLLQEGGESPQLSRWAQYLAGRSDGDLCPSPELKGLLRSGVPQEYRQRVWRWMVRTRTRTIREHHPQRYQQLCEKSRTSPHPACRQIQLDLHRTLTTNQHFSSPSSPALQQLRRVLLAFSWQSPAIGYCQGLNRLAAIALLVLQSEEDAFWCLVAVVEAIMPQDYYTQSLVASQADQRVLKDFLAEKLPRLASHFDEFSIDVSLITFNWFLVVFVESLPSDILLPLWDAFLYEGTKVIFRYALALFKYKEDDILKIQDSVEIYQYLRFFTKTISDSRRLTTIAFSVMNPFPGRLLRNRRALHLERLQGELRELEELQREFVTESAERKDKDLDTMVSEDDEEL